MDWPPARRIGAESSRLNRAARPARTLENLARCTVRESNFSHLVNRMLSESSRKVNAMDGAIRNKAGTPERSDSGTAQLSSKLSKETIRTLRLSSRGRL